MWVIVKVYHGDADKVHIETRETKEEMLTRFNDLIGMVKECDDEIIEENRNEMCDCGCNAGNEFWWNITFKDGILVTIDTKLI